MSNDVSDREVIITRVLSAPRAMVWEAMINAKHIVNYWGPDGFTTTIESMDLRVGGEWRYLMIGPDGTRFPNLVVYKEIIPLSKLVSDHGDGDRVWFESTVTLQDADGGTLVTLRHLFPSKEERDLVVEKYGAIEGGKQHLSKLETYLQENLA